MATAAVALIETAKVSERRLLRFNSIDEAIAEADRLVGFERKGRLAQLGNWTLGQALNHIGGWAEFSYCQCPLKTPWFIRLILWLQKRSFLYGRMPAGVKIPGVQNGTLVTELVSLDEGLGRFKHAFQRLKTEEPTHPSPALGKLTHEEAIAINLRHAELHLGFFESA
jgi:hypothetical protein